MLFIHNYSFTQDCHPLKFSNSIKTDLPKTLLIAGIDVWMFSCVGFIVLSLVELAIVDFVEKVNQERMKAEADLALLAMELQLTRRKSSTPVRVQRTDLLNHRLSVANRECDERSISTQSLLRLDYFQRK